ncbi:Vacuolar protein sorting-associated protein 5 [Entomortierella chlamydospora]|uniref:Vacuolar protein sorting-associated protein 5 n=1 Tax=Entomortierella chlamydospora TaxID=101097 RepID=A0A9P6MMZ3_9FUNG|nr:Vacuolar protein sorting-associated protein 5 [Entomortierella chlamydospora]KAG0007940.1 Vacuolar protein sorting-associated protein 5 [Entomortierella chlamydospora]
MTSPTGSVSDLLATSSSGIGGSGGTLDASTFIDPFSESNPFADDSLGPVIPPPLRSSQSLNFNDYYPQPTTIATAEDDDEPAGGSSSHYESSTFTKSFSAMDLAGGARTSYEDASPVGSPYEEQERHDSDGGQRTTGEGLGGHQRWDSVDSNPQYDSDEQQASNDHSTERRNERIGQYRPESTRSIGSQMSFRLPENGVLPWFEITVGEPQKVGDVISHYIVYKVHIKTNSTAFKSNDFTVQRRYRDFLWLYNQLTTHNPGVIVPPVSEKHALGRFQDEFVESRRIALERCLRKITAHPMLYGDPDLKLFLESESLVAEIKEKRQDSKGFMTKFGETLSSATTFTKVHETDEWFESRRNQLDVLDSQLKSLLKAIEAIIKQRKDLGSASAEFGESIVSLAGTELNKPLANSLLVLGNLKIRIKELHDRQAQMDVLTLEHTVDEYIRTIGSIKIAFMARAKFNQSMVQAQNDLSKKKANFEKMSQPSRKTKPERIQQLQQEITEAEQRVESTKKDFEEISSLVRQEFDRFDREKVEDFKQSVEAFLASMVKHQREIVGLWENYFKALSGVNEEQSQAQPQQQSTTQTQAQGSMQDSPTDQPNMQGTLAEDVEADL